MEYWANPKVAQKDIAGWRSSVRPILKHWDRQIAPTQISPILQEELGAALGITKHFPDLPLVAILPRKQELLRLLAHIDAILPWSPLDNWDRGITVYRAHPLLLYDRELDLSVMTVGLEIEKVLRLDGLQGTSPGNSYGRPLNLQPSIGNVTNLALPALTMLSRGPDDARKLRKLKFEAVH